MRLPHRGLLLGFLVVVAAGALAYATLQPRPAFSDDETTTANLGKAISKLDLKDVDGKVWSLADLKGKKAVVVVFLGTECPINNAYMPRLKEVHKTFAEQEVLLVGINSNKQD